MASEAYYDLDERVYGQEQGPTGLPKNCNSWGEYEAVDAKTKTKTLCHGGTYGGDLWAPCPSRSDCAKATRVKQERLTEGRRYLQTLGQSATNTARPFGSSTVLAQTHPAPTALDLNKHMTGFAGWTPRTPATIPSSPNKPAAVRPQATLPNPLQLQHPLPYPVQPPTEWPSAMHQPYAGPLEAGFNGQTPTFLPRDGESIAGRLGNNIVQGMIGSMGWHIFNYARTVDLFGRRR